MRHKNGYNNLGRESSHRKAMIRNMATSLVKHESITTTLTKAKAIRSVVEKLVTLGKKGEIHHRRLAAQTIREKDVVAKLFNEVAPRFQDRPGGYLRILKRGVRFGDGAHMATVQFVDYDAIAAGEALKAAREARAAELQEQELEQEALS